MTKRKTETARALGRYRLIAVLGQGGMARVYLAVVRGPAGFNKLLVVKELRPDLTEDPDFLAMFLDEARLAARLNHPNVVQTYEVGEDGDSHFIAMEYLEGQALSSLLRHASKETVKPEVHLKILSIALLGLHYAHELTDFDGTPLEVVHRDVSPQNVFVTYDGQVKIVDFGIAKALGAVAKTRAGTIKGKLRYMAPEQAISEPIDRRTDIFSFGVMLWEALAGKRFAHGKTDVEMVHQRVMGTEPRIRDVNPEVPEALAKICDRAMARAPDDRYASAAALHQDLEQAIEAVYGRVTTEHVASAVRETFAEDRKKLRALVDEQIKLADSVPSSDFAEIVMLDIGEATLRSDDHGSPIREAATLRVTDDSLQGTAPPSALSGMARRSRSRRWPYVAVAGAAVAAGAYGFSRIGRSLPTFHASASGEQISAPAPIAPSASAIPAAATVELDVSATPSDAQLELDGAPLASNPFRATLQKDAALHRLKASAPGFSSAERVVAFDRNVALKIELAPEAPPPSSKTKTSAPPQNVGESLKAGSGKKPRVIDEKDPYGK